MKMADPQATRLCNELDLLNQTFDLTGARLLELGCGRADKTRTLARAGQVAEIVAMEVDQIQHQRNLAAPQDKVVFCSGGAEAIPAPDGAFDGVMMFKSLHHVPVAHMDQALREIARVLKPGGWAWLSEPVYAGALNEVMRLFHDEQVVRAAAFAAVQNAVQTGLFELVSQEFFLTRSYFESFEQFDERMIQVTHTQHRLAPEVYQQVRIQFSQHLGPHGAEFHNPNRVDVLRKPS